MNKLVALIVGGVVVVGGGTAFLLTRGHDDKTVKVTNTATGQSTQVKTGNDAIVSVDACDVLTDSIARSVLGAGATKGTTPSATAASTEDTSVSSCTYYYKPVTTGPVLQQLQSQTTASVFVMSGKTAQGVSNIKAAFNKKPEGSTDVSGYGDGAYFEPSNGKLIVLKGGNQYIISHYTGVSGTKGTLDQAKQLADALKDNLK